MTYSVFITVFAIGIVLWFWYAHPKVQLLEKQIEKLKTQNLNLAKCWSDAKRACHNISNNSVSKEEYNRIRRINDALTDQIKKHIETL